MKFLVMLACLCPTVSAQTAKCRAQLQHYSVAEEQGSTYLFLFSENGTEVYADTRYTGMDSISYQVSVYGMNLLIVYQSETARQAMIQQLLREKYVSRFGSARLIA